jgi:trehalose 6-phosphate phosphatase
MIVPPPTPSRPLNAPAAVAIAASFRIRSRDTGGDTSRDELRHGRLRVTAAQAVSGRIAQLLLPLRADPRSAAVLCDIDGTLAPIVADPVEARVPADTREALRALARRFGLVACVSGRRAVQARSVVGVDELTYAGNHGLELLRPGASEADLDPAVGERARAAHDFVGELDPSSLSQAGLSLEDKGPIQALHWRTASEQRAAEHRAAEVAARAERAGLVPHWGRKVLEIRPTSEVHKGTAVRRLVAATGVRRALFAGDDRTDVDAFDALRAISADGGLQDAVCIGVASEEQPADLAEHADALVEGPDELRGVLRWLAGRRAEPAG